MKLINHQVIINIIKYEFNFAIFHLFLNLINLAFIEFNSLNERLFVQLILPYLVL